MDDGVKGMIIFGVALTLSVAFLLYRRFTNRVGAGDLRPTDSDPRAQAAVAALRAGDPGALLGLLHGLGADWGARAYYLEHLVVHCKRESLDLLCGRQPSPLAFLVRGRHAIQWAWEARGRGSSDSVSKEGWRLFAERIAMAERDLLAAANGDPADPTPYALLLVVDKANDAPMDVALQHFAAATARLPDHYFAHTAMLSRLSKRWGGSDEAMFDFVRRRVASAPNGSDLPMLVFEAHLDVWSYMHTFGGDPQGALRYLAQPAVRQELDAAYARSLGAGSIPRATTIHYRNAAAFLFFITQDPRLRTELERIGQAFTEYPWVYFAQADQETRDVTATARLVAGLR